MLDADNIEFVKGLATVLAAAPAETQIVFLATLAKGMDVKKLDALLTEVQGFATEEESVALAELSRAINERDVIETNDPVVA